MVSPTLAVRGHRLTEEQAQALRRRASVPATARLARYWLTRMRFIATLRVQTQAIVELNLGDECLYCGATAGLFVELM